MRKADSKPHGSGGAWRMGKKAVLLAALAGVMAGTVTAYGQVYVSDSLYDWDSNADSSYGTGYGTGYGSGMGYSLGSGSGTGYGSGSGSLSGWTSAPGSAGTAAQQGKDENTGPGVQNGSEEKVQITKGPSVTQVTLQERYNEEYKIYEESAGDVFFFYTNVANGGITDKSVILDIPRNMFCTMEKDGSLIDYTPGTAVSDYGTYVVQLTGIVDPNVPFSEQEEYRAVFRFRIQEKPPQEEGTGLGGKTSGIGYQVDWGNYASGQSQSGLGTGGTGSTGTENQEETKAGLFDDPFNLKGSGQSQEDETEESQEETAAAEESGPSQEESAQEDNQDSYSSPQDAGTGGNTYAQRTQAYAGAMGRYEVTFENGRTLITNIPEGYMGPGTVELTVSDGEPAVLYKDDEPQEYVPGDNVAEPGHYRLDVDGQMWSFTIASAVREVSRYLAPSGMEIAQASLDGEPLELQSARYLSMDADGQYQISLLGKEGEGMDVLLKKDTEAPEAAVSVKGGRADIQYLSDDITEITLEKDGEIQEGFSGYVINSPGSYRLTVADAAGNRASQEFSLKYQVNMYGVVAVILVVLLIIGGVVFVIHTKKTVKVR